MLDSMKMEKKLSHNIGCTFHLEKLRDILSHSVQSINPFQNATKSTIICSNKSRKRWEVKSSYWREKVELRMVLLNLVNSLQYFMELTLIHNSFWRLLFRFEEYLTMIPLRFRKSDLSRKVKKIRLESLTNSEHWEHEGKPKALNHWESNGQSESLCGHQFE